MTAAWIDTMRDADVIDVADALGLELRARSTGSWISPCPACGAERRHTRSRDRRGAVGVRTDRRGWRCHQCDASGDAIDLAAHAIAGGRMRELPDHRRAEVRDWCVRYTGGDPTSATPRPRKASPPPAPEYPPVGEVSALWRSCLSVLDVPAVCTYLRRRGLDAVAVHDADLARAVPDGIDLPRWARIAGRPWADTGHRLVVPLVDAAGTMRSVLARRVTDGDSPKSIAPAGYSRAELVMADGVARQILEHGEAPEWWGDAEPLRVVVAEGEIDHLAWATVAADTDAHAPAVLGVVSGAWSPKIAARIPDGAVVVVATDADHEGDRYADRIAETFAGREVRLERYEMEVAA